MKLDYAIIDAIDSVSIFWKDLEGRFLGCNKYVYQVVAGLENRSDVVGKLDSELPWSSQADKLREIDQAVVRDNKCHQMQETIIMDDGSVMVFLTSKTPLLENNKIIGIVGVSIDITERTVLAQKLAKKEQEIALLQKSKF